MEVLPRLLRASHSKLDCLVRQRKLRVSCYLCPSLHYNSSSYNVRSKIHPILRCRTPLMWSSLSSAHEKTTRSLWSIHRPMFLYPPQTVWFSSKPADPPLSLDQNEKQKSQSYRENIWTIPNILCVSRMALCPYLGYLVVQGNYPTALGFFIFAGITDLLDGWIARNFKNQASLAGSFLDPMADKLLIGTLFITLTYMELIPGPLTGLIITRDVLLMASGFYIRYVSLPPPRTFRRYFDVGRPTAQLSPTFISKINTALQLTLVATTLGAPIADYVDHPLLFALWYTIAGTTILSGLSYVFGKNTYRILKQKI